MRICRLWSTHEVYDIDADDLRDLLQRLEARISAR
jgi:CBS-domain-containing membrane protein